ncbi:MAG TPA: lysophospholipid acyltransferase family protein [Gemmatimonadales bacterium]|nr:lysophospholipid acyltransferase family protein [Gemmatimonadales bacterium]
MIGVLRYVAALALCTGVQGGWVILASLFGVKHRPGGVYDRAPRAWARGLIRMTGLPVRVSGLEKLAAQAPVVYVCNHTSFADIWVLLATLPGSVRFVAKRELLSVPFFGRAIRASGQIPINRRNLRDAFAAYDDAAVAIRGGMSAIVFVEGTRSRDGRLAEFKKGPFVLAIRAGVPVVPVHVAGGRDALPPGAWGVRRVPVTVSIGSLLPTVDLDFDDRDAILTAARSEMLRLECGVDAPPAGG